MANKLGDWGTEQEMGTDLKSSNLTLIGRYGILGEIGRGGMGVVYRGVDKLIGRDVAIKTLTEVTPELRDRFYVEARSGMLSHPNIVTVYEVGEHDGSPFIAMEFLPGESLEWVLRERGRMPLLETLSIVEQLCAGLGYAHQSGLIHRDVKPANVIVLRDGQVKIVDFGIARLTDQMSRLTKPDALLGTFHYIAPERLKGEVSDSRADIWSLGVMLYEMVTGELPFRGKDVSALYRVMHEPYVPVRSVVNDVPEALTAVLDRALAKDVNLRYSTTEEMAVDLQVVGEGFKQERVGYLLDTARRLCGQGEFASARTVVLQAQRISPRDVNAKLLLQEVQDRLNSLQRGEQIRQVMEQAEEATAARQFDDAITFFTQADRLDQEKSFGITARLEQVKTLKDQSQRVRSLWGQANDARSKGDLIQAEEFLSEALRIDKKNTDLKNARSIVLREIKQRQQAGEVERLVSSAREEYGARRYTEAIVCLREAAEIDPTDGELQDLLLSATTKQKEERRRILLDRIVGEIHDCLEIPDFERAEDQVSRALETLPSEPVLLRMRSELEKKKEEAALAQLVRSATLEAQELLNDEPDRALAVVVAALRQAPQEENLMQFRAKLEEHLRQLDTEILREKRLSDARASILAESYDEAIRALESAKGEGDQRQEVQELLDSARAGQRAKQAEARMGKDAQSNAAQVKHVTQERKGPAASSKTGSKRLALGFLGLALAVAAAAGFWHIRQAASSGAARPSPSSISPVSAPRTYLDVNASPWAVVMSVQNAAGNNLDLSGKELTTPLRLDDVPAGSYMVTLKGGDEKTQTVRCVAGPEEHPCVAVLDTPELREVMTGEQP